MGIGRVVAAAVLGLGLLVGQARAAVWDLQADWSEVSNPNGAWSLRHGDTLLTWFAENAATGITGQGMWAASDVVGSFVPVIYRAAYDGAGLGFNYLTGDIFAATRDLANGSGNGEGIIAWTSPGAGVIDIAGSLFGMRLSANLVDWELRLGDVLLDGGGLDGAVHTRDARYALSETGLVVAAGDVVTLRFAVAPGLAAEALGITLTVSGALNQAEVPEPGTLALLGVAAAALLARRTGWGRGVAWMGSAAAVVAGLVAAGPAAAGPYAAAVLADTPYAYWRLDETSGTVAADSSGNGRDGNFIAAPLLGQGGALAEAGNSAVRFSASSGQYVNLPHAFGGVGWTEITVEAWVNILGLTGNFQAIVSSTGSGVVHFQAYEFGGNNVVYGTTTSPYLPIIPPNANSGWHHVAMTSKSGEQKLYLDGNLIGSDTALVTQIAAASSLRIGSGCCGGRYFDGLIDEVAIYRTALSEAQIDAHFAAANETGVPEPGTLALLGAAVVGLAGMQRGGGLRFG